MNFFDRLETTTALERKALINEPFIQAGVSGTLDLPAYVAFLGQAYQHVKHTVPLLMACGARLPERLGWLRNAVGHYIEEETGHEEWILNDICACGGDAEAVRNAAPHLETELMVAYAYDTIARRNPVGFFGMVYVLEGTSVQVASRAADALQRALGLPKKAFTYLRSHGDLDVGHVQFFRDLINRLDQDNDEAAVVHCAKAMFRLYGDIFRSLPWHPNEQEVIYATQ
ncbi:MAG: iron-containing redox enzyme family protein [Acidiferrobacterales bacterium]|nr:iron-containing redox enzyme family protein [Acidiferrobacterales bacterium]